MEQAELDKQLVIECGKWGSNDHSRLTGLILEGADVNCKVPSENMGMLIFVNKDPFCTPLIASLKTGKSFENIKPIVQLLCINHADPSIMSGSGHNALYYALKLVIGSRYKHKVTNTLPIEILQVIVSNMTSQNLDIEIVHLDQKIAPLEYILSPDFGDTSSQAFEAAKLILDRGANPNSVSENLINLLLEDYMLQELDFFTFFLAKGLMLNGEGKEILNKNSVSCFFIHSGVEFCGFFQKFENDSNELLLGLIKIQKCIQSKVQQLAFYSWLRYGIDEIVQKIKGINIVSDFLMQMTNKDLQPASRVLLNCLKDRDIKNLFLVVAIKKLEKDFPNLDRHKKEVTKIAAINAENVINIDEYICENFLENGEPKDTSLLTKETGLECVLKKYKLKFFEKISALKKVSSNEAQQKIQSLEEIASHFSSDQVNIENIKESIKSNLNILSKHRPTWISSFSCGLFRGKVESEEIAKGLLKDLNCLSGSSSR